MLGIFVFSFCVSKCKYDSCNTKHGQGKFRSASFVPCVTLRRHGISPRAGPRRYGTVWAGTSEPGAARKAQRRVARGPAPPLALARPPAAFGFRAPRAVAAPARGPPLRPRLADMGWSGPGLRRRPLRVRAGAFTHLASRWQPRMRVPPQQAGPGRPRRRSACRRMRRILRTWEPFCRVAPSRENRPRRRYATGHLHRSLGSGQMWPLCVRPFSGTLMYTCYRHGRGRRRVGQRCIIRPIWA